MPDEEHGYHLKTIVKKFEGKSVVLETEDKQTIHWPIKNLPDDIQEGDLIRLIISTNKTDQEAREKLAQVVINKILNN